MAPSRCRDIQLPLGALRFTRAVSGFRHPTSGLPETIPDKHPGGGRHQEAHALHSRLRPFQIGQYRVALPVTEVAEANPRVVRQRSDAAHRIRATADAYSTAPSVNLPTSTPRLTPSPSPASASDTVPLVSTCASLDLPTPAFAVACT